MKSINEIKYLYTIYLDEEKDLWNWYMACNEQFQGIDWKDEIPVELSSKIAGKGSDEAFIFLKPYLKQRYIEEKKLIDDDLRFFNDAFEDRFQKGCQKIVDTIGKPLYKNEYKIFLTTFPRCPYYFDEGGVAICTGCKDPIAIFLHELVHFQFINYWIDDPNSILNKISDNEFEWIKESLTIILDEDFLDVIDKVDSGYEMHKEFRLMLHEFWVKSKDFNSLVEFAIDNLSKFYHE